MFNWLEKLAALLVSQVFKIDISSHLGKALTFFFYDTVKIYIMLSLMIFIISIFRTYINTQGLKKTINKFNGFTGHLLASLFGVVTPFCSCSSVPLFIAFVEGGIPVAVTMSFLITSPIVNEAAFAILLASFGWKIAIIYALCGIIVGVVGGIIIGLFKPRRWVEEYVFKMQVGESAEIAYTAFSQRLCYAWEQVKEIIKRVWYYIIIGIGIGAAIHGWIPTGALAKYAGPDNPFAVIVAVLFGVPLYSNALGTIPIAEALIDKGVGLGTALAFMMAVTALSLPECIILKKVIKPQLIALFIISASIGIVAVGYLFNILF